MFGITKWRSSGVLINKYVLSLKKLATDNNVINLMCKFSPRHKKIDDLALSNDLHKRQAKNGSSNAQIAVKREYVIEEK